MENPLITVVVPIYNVELYLKRCINSILKQSYSNLEIIMVDDGSEDNSGLICDEYEKKDERIQVIHKGNGGLSDARNAGINIAKGAFITFIDSDDFVSLDYIDSLYELILKYNTDISGCYHKKFANDREIPKRIERKEAIILSGVEAVIDLCYQKHITNSAWGKLYRMSLFEKNRYPVGKLYEDLGTTYKLFLLCDKVAFSMEEKYYYFQRNNSIMHYDFSKKNMDRIILSEELYDNVKNVSRELRSAAETRLFISSVQVLREMPLDNEKFKEEKSIVTKYIKLYRKKVLFNKDVKKINRVIAFSTYFGLKRVQGLGKVYKYFYQG